MISIHSSSLDSGGPIKTHALSMATILLIVGNTGNGCQSPVSTLDGMSFWKQYLTSSCNVGTKSRTCRVKSILMAVNISGNGVPKSVYWPKARLYTSFIAEIWSSGIDPYLWMSEFGRMTNFSGVLRIYGEFGH